MISVSIITPTFNRAELLQQTAATIRQQSGDHIEWIIVDDRSDDDTLLVAKQLQHEDSRIKIFQRNRFPSGACTCRNIGFENALGEWVMFLDSDDLLAADCINGRLKMIEENAGADLYVFSSAFFTSSPADTPVLWNRFTKERDLDRFLSGDPVWHTAGGMWRRSFLEQAGVIFNENLLSGQDWEFHVHALLSNPAYIKAKALPDNFIRRNPKSSRISDSHFDPVKIANRVSEKIRYLAHPRLNNPQKKILLYHISRELISYYNKCGYLPENSLEGLRSHFAVIPFADRRVFTFLRILGSLKKRRYWLQRIAFFLLAARALKVRSSYRSQMSHDEVEQLKSVLARYETIINI